MSDSFSGSYSGVRTDASIATRGSTPRLDARKGDAASNPSRRPGGIVWLPPFEYRVIRGAVRTDDSISTDITNVVFL